MSSDDVFLRDMEAAGWTPRSDHEVRMRIAYRFIWARFSQSEVTRPATDPVHGGNMYAFKIHGVTPTWLAWMQAIDFDHAVIETTIEPGVSLRNYREPGQSSGGNWYARVKTPPSKLAIKPTQTRADDYLTGEPTLALRSTAGDVLVDWGMTTPAGRRPMVGQDYWYRHGGGVQYLIPNARLRLKSST